MTRSDSFAASLRRWTSSSRNSSPGRSPLLTRKAPEESTHGTRVAPCASRRSIEPVLWRACMVPTRVQVSLSPSLLRLLAARATFAGAWESV